jgi:hypothetical protein
LETLTFNADGSWTKTEGRALGGGTVTGTYSGLTLSGTGSSGSYTATATINGDTLTITRASGDRGGATQVDGTWTRAGGGPTIKLAQDGTNKFTLTISDATWSKTYDGFVDYASGIRRYLELDGDIIGEEDDDDNKLISLLGDIPFTAARTSDTVLTFTMSRPKKLVRNYFGSGKLKLKSSNSDPGYCLIDSDWIEGGKMGSVRFKIAEDVSVEFDFPKETAKQN